MDAAVGCDWLQDESDKWGVKPRDAKRMRNTVAVVRFLLKQTASVTA